MLSLVKNGSVVLERNFLNIDNVPLLLSPFQERCRPSFEKGFPLPKMFGAKFG